MPKKSKNLLLQLDKFSKNVNLQINSEDNHKTYFGMIATLLNITLIICATYYFGRELF